MRKFYINFLSFSLFSWGLAACRSNDEPAADELQFFLQSSIGGVFQAGGGSMSRTPQLDAQGQGTFSNGDVNTVFFLDTDNHCLENFSYTYGKTYYWNDFQLNEVGTEMKVAACYPAVKADQPARFVWNVTSPENATPDFLAASPVSVKSGITQQVPLDFSHLMHRLVVALEADGTTITNGDLADAKVTIARFYPESVINLFTATVEDVSGSVAQMQAKGTGVSFILPPQPVGDIEVKIEVNSYAQVFKLSDLKVASSPLTHLESGKAFTLKVRVSKSSFTITGQGIGPWGSQGEANGEIII